MKSNNIIFTNKEGVTSTYTSDYIDELLKDIDPKLQVLFQHFNLNYEALAQSILKIDSLIQGLTLAITNTPLNEPIMNMLGELQSRVGWCEGEIYQYHHFGDGGPSEDDNPDEF